MNNKSEDVKVESKTKKENYFLIVLLVLFVGLAIGSSITSSIVYKNYVPKDTTKEPVKEEEKELDDAVGAIEDNLSKEENTYESMAGEYEYKNTQQDNNEYHSLYLYENGNFWYDVCENVCYGSAGNYLIKDGKIVLNKIVNFGSDAEANVAESEETIEIIKGTSKLEKQNNNIAIDFTKKDTNVNSQEFYDKLNQRILTTKASITNE